MDSLFFSSIPSFQDPSQTSSHHTSNLAPTTPQNQNNERSAWPRHHLSRNLFIMTILLTFFSITSASKYIPIAEEMVERSPLVEVETESLGSTFARLARSGTIIVDQSPPPDLKNDWEFDAADLRRRTSNPSSSSSSSSAEKISTKTGSSSTLAPTTTSSSGIVAATTTSVASLPTPFDTGFNNNITTSCATFMNSMLSNATFKSCLPFSLLLQNSNSFFQASKSLVRITQTLDYSCSANLTQCTSLLSSLATSLPLPTNCGSDLASQNPTIQQAHLGLLAYPTLYTASCLRNPSTSSYCFADAITNASSPSDNYIYFLPLNVSLVGGSQPTCNACLKNTMNIFEAKTAEKGSAIRDTYASAAMQVNVNCGPGFVNASLAAVAVTSSSPSSISLPFGSNAGVLVFVLVSMIASWLL